VALIALVGSGKTKAPARPGPGTKAKDLYVGNLFRAARAYAEKHAARWYILSGMYGLSHPETRLQPYERPLKSLSGIEREVWELAVRQQIRRVVGPKDKVLLLAGADYEGAVSGMENVSRPLGGLGVGEQLHWFKMKT